MLVCFPGPSRVACVQVYCGIGSNGVSLGFTPLSYGIPSRPVSFALQHSALCLCKRVSAFVVTCHPVLLWFCVAEVMVELYSALWHVVLYP